MVGLVKVLVVAAPVAEAGEGVAAPVANKTH